MNDTECLYEITKLTKQALTMVEKGYTPYSEYRRIVAIIESDEQYSKNKNFRKTIAKTVKTFVFITSALTTLCYGVRGFFCFLDQGTFWPGFGYILFACVTGTITAMLEENFF